MPAQRKYTPEIHRLIVECLADGNYRKVAASVGGIDEDTLKNWIDAGDEGDEQLAQFASDVHAAEIEAERSMVEVVRVNAKEDWHAAAWWLARKCSKEWGGTNKTELTGAGGGPVQTADVTKMTDAELAAIIAGTAGSRRA
ncbi:MAG: hypothetical protein WC563_16245 [Brevundimonas sp.]